MSGLIGACVQKKSYRFLLLSSGEFVPVPHYIFICELESRLLTSLSFLLCELSGLGVIRFELRSAANVDLLTFMEDYCRSILSSESRV